MPELRHQFLFDGDATMIDKGLASPAREVFIIRFWLRTTGDNTWTGLIHDVGTGAATRIRDARELHDYLARQFDPNAPLPGREEGLK